VTGVGIFVSELKDRGVTWISTLCGHGLNPLFAACRDAGLRLVDTRNEQAASYMAEVWGKLTRSVGVCAVSSGVAHVNAMTGVVNAHFDGSPMLLITGAGSLETAGMGHFQDLDQVSLAAPVCKYARVVDVPARIPQFVNEAFAAALTGRPGPVHLTFPLDVQTAEVNEGGLIKRTGEIIATTGAPVSADDRSIESAVELLRKAERPLLIAGSGVYYAEGGDAVEDFCKSLDIPCVIPIWDRGCIHNAIPQFMGVLGAASGGAALLRQADLVIALGVSYDYRIGYLLPPAVSTDAQVVRVDADPQRLHAGVAADLLAPSDPASFLTSLTAVAQRRGIVPFSEWLCRASDERERFRTGILTSRSDSGNRLHPLDIVDALRQVVDDETVLIIDGGNIGQWYHQAMCDRYPGHHVTCGASGVIGFGIPGGIAARLAYPDRPVILLSGDGSITFTIADLECAARQRLPFVAIVADDESWGIAANGLVKQYGEAISSNLGPVQFDVVARGLGCQGVRVNQPKEILPAIHRGLEDGLPTVIHIPIVSQFPGN